MQSEMWGLFTFSMNLKSILLLSFGQETIFCNITNCWSIMLECREYLINMQSVNTHYHYHSSLVLCLQSFISYKAASYLDRPLQCPAVIDNIPLF